MCWIGFRESFVLFFPVVFLSVRDSHQTTEEDRLIYELFNDYNRDVRPVFNKSEAVDVYFGIVYSQIVDVDEKNQILTSNIWIRQIWTNPLLQWNSSKYQGLTTINVDPKKVWVPDIVLYNNADDLFGGGLDKFETRIVLDSDGRNMWLAPHIFKSSCKIDVKYFPFDEQRCPLKFGSWTYDGFRLNFTQLKNHADTDRYVKNGEWDLVEIPAVRNELVYPCCIEPYPDITYTVIVRRRTLFYFTNLIIPCILITTLTILSFFLPPESGERITLVITILLAMTVFLLLVAESMPPTSEVVPLIGIYYSAAMFEISLSLVATCMTLKLYYRHPADSQMSPLFRKMVLGYLRKLFRVGNHIEDNRMRDVAEGRITIKTNKLATDGEGNTASDTEEIDHRNAVLPTKKRTSIRNSVGNNNITLSELGLGQSSNGIMRQRRTSTSQYGYLSPYAEKLVQGINSLAIRIQKQEHADAILEEWQLAAIVIDKALFWIFIFTILISTLSVFLSAPRWYE